MGISEGLTIRNVPVDELKLEGGLSTNSSGVKEITGKLSGTVHPLTTLQPAGTLLQGFQSINVSANGTFRENILTIEDLQAQSSASTVSGAKFQVNFADKQIGGTIPTFRLDLTDVSSEVTGNAYLSADAAGTIDQPTAAFKVSSDGLDIRGNHIDAVEIEGTFANDLLVVTNLEARRAEGVANATGSFNLATQDVQGQAIVTNLKIVEVPDLSGTAFLKAQIKGSYQSPAIEFNGDLRDVLYKDQEHGNVRFEGSTDLKTATLQATSGKYAASLTGQIRLEAPYAFTAGLISNQSRITYGEYDVMADGRARISGEAQPFKPTQIELENFHVRGEGVELMANGPINPGTEVQLRVNLAELPIQGVELEGMARGLATISGNWRDPSIKGSLATEGATVRIPQMTEPAAVSARVEFTGRDLSIPELRATYAGATATITGNGSWSGSGKIQFRVADIRPENLAPGKGITGTAELEGEIDIANLSLDGISGHAKVPVLSIKVRDAEIHQKQPLEVEFRNQLLTVTQFELEGLETYARITGHADLRDRSLHFDADADTDLAILEPFIPNSRPDGRVKTRLALRGTPEKPDLEGEISISDGQLIIDRPDVDLSKLNVEAELRGNRLEIKKAGGLFNGGPFEASGGTGVSGTGLQDAVFRVKAERSQLEYPEGLQSETTSELTLTGTMPNLTLAGRVDVLNAIYQKDFKLGQELFSRITNSSRLIGPTVEAGGMADQIRLEIEVQTPGPIVVKNNVAELEAEGTFRVRGTVANPILLGRAVVAEGGELYFGPTLSSEDLTQRSDRYSIERGSIDFNNPLRTDPELDFRATHELEIKDERYLITLEVTGTPETLKPRLTSDPYLEENDIVTMLLTGRTFEELQGTYANFAGEQALGYVSGQLSERVLNQAGNVVGLSTVRIDPVSVAEQTDLGARLTIAKEVTDEFEMVYSHTLNDAKNQTWILSYKPFENLVFRGVSDADQNEAIVDVKHDLKFGGGDPLLKRKQPASEIRLRNVTFAGTHFGEKELQKQVTKEGSPFGPYRVSQDVRNIRRFLASQGFPQSKVQAQQTTDARNADVHFDITEGPKILLAYEGAEVPESVRKEIQQLWALRSSDAGSLRDSTAELLRHFRSQGYLQAKVSAPDPVTTVDGRHYTFKIEPGFRFDKPLWVFKGIEPMDIPEPAGEVLENPVAVKQRIEAQYRSNAYLDVSSTVPELIVLGTKAHFEVTVNTGKPYTVGSIEFEGIEAFTAQHLREVVGGADSKSETSKPVPFTYQWLETARQHLTSEYWGNGYNDVQIVPSTSQNSELATATVRFTITEGELQRIEAIEIVGRPLTSRAFIERQFEFKKGDPVDQTKINLTRKKLYDTRLFRRVEIEMVRGTTGYIARVVLTENAPWQLRYGLAVTEHLDDGERDTGVTADLTYKNLFRRGVITGVSGKVDADDRDLRWFISFPQILGRKVNTSLTFFRTIEDADTEDLVDYWGGTIQQQWRFGQHYVLSYDYSNRKVLRGERDPENPTKADEEDTILDDPRIPIARFDVSVSRDTRDDILNATRGTFLSNSFEIAPKGIGSSVEFIRNYSQFMHFRPVKRFVFASAIRFGVAQSLGDDTLDTTLQFRTGGSTTVRAFEKDELTNAPGDYELVLNGEFRFPIFWWFSGATFIDAGQVAVRSKDLFKFRYGPGIGIRIDTPFLMFRTDLGINVDPRDGEAKGRWWFGIGQAF
ncbi:MAG TPA: translocation/assembly module TamB domain-containing protein [Terriglobia bacterium]|nr:translocation/assembly module TamB domain-containing protein [Terriglobia bacterium]